MPAFFLRCCCRLKRIIYLLLKRLALIKNDKKLRLALIKNDKKLRLALIKNDKKLRLALIKNDKRLLLQKLRCDCVSSALSVCKNSVH